MCMTNVVVYVQKRLAQFCRDCYRNYAMITEETRAIFNTRLNNKFAIDDHAAAPDTMYYRVLNESVASCIYFATIKVSSIYYVILRHNFQQCKSQNIVTAYIHETNFFKYTTIFALHNRLC